MSNIGLKEVGSDHDVGAGYDSISGSHSNAGSSSFSQFGLLNHGGSDITGSSNINSAPYGNFNKEKYDASSHLGNVNQNPHNSHGFGSTNYNQANSAANSFSGSFIKNGNGLHNYRKDLGLVELNTGGSTISGVDIGQGNMNGGVSNKPKSVSTIGLATLIPNSNKAYSGSTAGVATNVFHGNSNYGRTTTGLASINKDNVGSTTYDIEGKKDLSPIFGFAKDFSDNINESKSKFHVYFYVNKLVIIQNDLLDLWIKM